MTYDFTIVGGGIIGLATAHALSRGRPGCSILVLEKERSWAEHQTGRNSGVIHSGLYYRPGTLKAGMAVAGNRSMVEFCREHGIEHRLCGKLVVATEEREIPPLRKLEANAKGNGVAVTWLDGDGARSHEPNVRAVAALHVPSTGVVDYRIVARKLAGILEGAADLRPRVAFRGLSDDRDAAVIETTAGAFRTRMLVNCGGLHSDRIASASGDAPGVRIVPFRGEYYSVAGRSADLVRTLVYPVPDPAFPFLGVHLTRGIGNDVHAGPNAVLALAREGYAWRDVNLRDTFSTLTYGGFWRLAAKYWDEGMREMVRSLSARSFVQSVQRLVPDVRAEDLVRAPAGVRAQALTASGHLADDFVIVRGRHAIHVCNAPSPGATASLEIGKHVAAMAVAG